MRLVRRQKFCLDKVDLTKLRVEYRQDVLTIKVSISKLKLDHMHVMSFTERRPKDRFIKLMNKQLYGGSAADDRGDDRDGSGDKTDNKKKRQGSDADDVDESDERAKGKKQHLMQRFGVGK